MGGDFNFLLYIILWGLFFLTIIIYFITKNKYKYIK